MKNLTIKSITSTNTKKDGTPLIGKFGAYYIVRADTEEEGTVTWFSKTAHTHQVGDVIEGNLEIKTSEVNGKTYTNKNFTFPKKEDLSLERITKLESRVMKLELSEERRWEELKKELTGFKNDLTIDMTGKLNTSSELARSDKNVAEVMKDLGIDDREIPDFDENNIAF